MGHPSRAADSDRLWAESLTDWWVHEGRIVARPMLPLTLSFYHAVIDGAPAARFTESLRAL